MTPMITLRSHCIALVIVGGACASIGWHWHARTVRPLPQVLSAAARENIRDWSRIVAIVGRVARDCGYEPSEHARQLIKTAMAFAPELFFAETARVVAEMTPETDCSQPGIRELAAQGWIAEGQP